MTFFERAARAERDLKWAQIWFKQLAMFHQHSGDEHWEYSADDVIAFSRCKLNGGMPAWKRLRMVQSLMNYRKLVQNRSFDDLVPVHQKLQEVVARERLRQDGVETIDEVVGKINPQEPDVIQQLRRKLRVMGMKYSTERAYVGKVKAFMRDRGLKCVADFANINGQDVESHLTDLAVDGNVAPSTQNQAFHALLFLFEHVFKRDIGRIEAIRASKGKQIPTVLSTSEVRQVFDQLQGISLVIAKLLYGCGLRISEALRLRIKDIDFENSLIEIHQSKGGKSRLLPLPSELVEPLRRALRSRRVLHEHDVADGIASVRLPYALAKKYPSAASQWKWQFLFASHRLSRDPRTHAIHRHHLHRDTFPGQLRRALQKTGIEKAVTSHTFRHCFATHLLSSGTDIRTIQELLGHSDVATTMIYTHVLQRDKTGVISPLDRLSVDGRESAVYETPEAQSESCSVADAARDVPGKRLDADVDEAVDADVRETRWHRRPTDRSRPTESQSSGLYRLVRWCFGGKGTRRKRGDPAHAA